MQMVSLSSMKQSWNQQVAMLTAERATAPGVPARTKYAPGSPFTTSEAAIRPDEFAVTTVEGSLESRPTSLSLSNQTVTLWPAVNPVPVTVTVCPLPNEFGDAAIDGPACACAELPA